MNVADVLTNAFLHAHLPDLSTWVFYFGNVVLVVAYVVVVALLLRPGGISGRGQLSPTVTTLLVLFLLTCSLLHIELAVNAYQRGVLTSEGGGVDVHLTLVILAKLALVVLGVVLVRKTPPPEKKATGSGAPVQITEAHIMRAVIDDARVTDEVVQHVTHAPAHAASDEDASDEDSGGIEADGGIEAAPGRSAR